MRTFYGRRSFKEALKPLNSRAVNVVITDMVMESAESGYDLLLFIKKQSPRTQVIVLTAFGTVENSVKCMRAGCFDYLSKDPDWLEKLVESVKRAIEVSTSGLDRESLAERLILSYWNEIERAPDTWKKGFILESLCSLLF